MESTTEHPDGMKLDYLTFSPYDYALFGGMLLVSALVGVYFGCYKKQNTANDYLLGGRTMGVFPIATSLAASYISAITLLGMPAEVYTHGTQYAMSCFGGLIATVIIGYVFLPVFYDLQLTSSYEYLELRFCKNVRLTASFIFLLDCIMTMPIVMYVPALAFNLVTGIDIKFINPVVCFVCIFYTTLGGLKAVVWTDTIQFVTMNGAIFVILLLGISNEGGLTKIWTNAEAQDRIHFFDFDLDPTKRVSFWTVTLGMCCGWISSLGVNQLCVQRFLSVPSIADAKKVLYIYSIVIAIIKALCLFSGLIMFSRYYGCDPLTAGVIARSDQILPYYVMDTTRNIPGLPGLFIAGVFSAALSSMSSILNTTSGVIYKDFICLIFPKEFTEKNASNIMKLIVVVVGTVTMSMVFIVEKLGSVLQVAISFSGVTNGAMLGVFVMGMIFPRANSKGTITGAFASVLFMSWMLYGNSMAISSGAVKYPVKSFAMDQCDSSINITSISSAVVSELEDTTPPEVYFLHRISFMWYSLMGTLTVFLVGLPVSYLTSPPSASQTKLEYFSPVVRSFLPDNIKQKIRAPKEEEAQYKQVDLLLYTTKENPVE